MTSKPTRKARAMAMVIPRTREAFDAVWGTIADDPNSTARVILEGDQLAGFLSCFKRDGKDYTGYIIGRAFWGRGIATRALALLLAEVPIRPLLARTAATNTASIRVLEKNGFTLHARGHCPGTDRLLPGEEITFILSS
ncbi:MAG: GNAT family N-acetyltransferase [Phycisphaerales bacterium]